MMGESKWKWQVAGSEKWNALFDNTDFREELPARGRGVQQEVHGLRKQWQIKGKSLLRAIKRYYYTSDWKLWITAAWEESWMWCSSLCSVSWRDLPWDLWPVETGDCARQVLDPTQ